MRRECEPRHASSNDVPPNGTPRGEAKAPPVRPGGRVARFLEGKGKPRHEAYSRRSSRGSRRSPRPRRGSHRGAGRQQASGPRAQLVVLQHHDHLNLDRPLEHDRRGAGVNGNPADGQEFGVEVGSNIVADVHLRCGPHTGGGGAYGHWCILSSAAATPAREPRATSWWIPRRPARLARTGRLDPGPFPGATLSAANSWLPPPGRTRSASSTRRVRLQHGGHRCRLQRAGSVGQPEAESMGPDQ